MDYYTRHALPFYSNTVDIDMTKLYDQFIPLVKEQGTILDAGCGSGRDSKYFKSLGFQVEAFDASPQLAQLASTYIQQTVVVETFETFSSDNQFDGIWACASLLHVPFDRLKYALKNLETVLAPKGILYCSFKYGTGEMERDSRHFTNMNENDFEPILSQAHLVRLRSWLSTDLRAGRSNEQWFNALLGKAQ